jgi:phage baseplate assembly protein V
MDYDSDSVFPVDKTGRDSEIRNLYRHGKVTEVLCDETQVCCRVQYLDKAGLISKPLPVKQFGSRSTSAFWCPKVGDDVSVQMLPNGDEDGFVDGSFYNTGNPPPITDPNTRHIRFADGTVIEYAEKDTGGARARNLRDTRGTGTLTINSVGPIDIICAGACSVQAGGAMTLKAPSITLDATDVKITGLLWVDHLKPYQAAEIDSNPHVKNLDGSGNGS